MKIIVPVFALAILVASCTEPKIQLRATEPAEANGTLVKDSVKADTVGLIKN